MQNRSYPQARTDDTFKALALVAAISAIVTSMVCAAVYQTDSQQAESWRAHQEYEAECVKHYRNGWSYDPCEVKALHEAALAVEEINRCTTNFEKQDAAHKDFDAACAEGQRPGAFSAAMHGH